ncbi:MAG: ABC transporter permease [Rhodospirillales bacterium]|nr:ABC transporter permease [Rhodospirillales bacterium]
MSNGTVSTLYAVATFLVVLAAWQIAVTALHVAPYFIPSPLAILHALIAGRALYAANFLVTLESTLIAFAVALAAGVLLGAMVSESRLLRRTLYPLLIAFQSMPRIALAPVIIVWFGFGISSKVVLGAFTAFFPIFLNTVHGMATADPDQLALMRILKANRMQVFLKVKLPGALPFLLAGANIGIIFAILAVIVGEFLGANRGMGFLIVNQSNQMDMAGTFASVFLLSATGIGFHYGLGALRRRLLFWSGTGEAGREAG